MNIDDYIFQSSTASPTGGVSPSPPTEAAIATSSNAVASAIPIKTKKEMQDSSHFPPSAPPPLDRMRNHEFDYVQRRLRKTSIDETRVSRLGRQHGTCNADESRNSLANDPQSSLRK